MSEYVAWMFELDVRDGCEGDLRTLMNEMVDATHTNEPGTLVYEWSFDESGKHLHLYERYAGNAAALSHISTFGSKFAARFFEILEPRRFVLFGNPNDEVRKALASPGMQVVKQAAGFSRA